MWYYLAQNFNKINVIFIKFENISFCPERYDDGGITAGNMERSSLKRLFADIEAGRIDCDVG